MRVLIGVWIYGELWRGCEFKGVIRVKDYVDEVIAHKDDLSDYDGDVLRFAQFFDEMKSYKLTARKILALYEDSLREQLSLF